MLKVFVLTLSVDSSNKCDDDLMKWQRRREALRRRDEESVCVPCLPHSKPPPLPKSRPRKKPLARPSPSPNLF